MSTNAESGLRNHRPEYIEEDTDSNGDPVTPSDPDWKRPSDRVYSVDWSPSPALEADRGLGDVDVDEHDKAPEEHELVVSYALQQWLVQTNFEDPDTSTTLGVASSDTGDTNIDVTIENDDGSVVETITTDGTDGTTFTAGSETFDSIGRVTLSSSPTGTITISEDDGGSAGTAFGTISTSGTVEDVVANDMAGDGVLRDRDNLLPNTHTFVDREAKGQVAATSTVEAEVNGVGGATAKESHIFTVIRGGKIGSITITVDPGDQQPATCEVTYQAEKGRRIQVDQPDISGEQLTVVSNNSSDSGTVTLEDEGAGTSEDVTITANGSETTTASFTSLDAIDLSTEQAGDIEIQNSSGEVLAVLYGIETYDGVDGDLGIPALGSGSHSSAIGNDYIRTLADSITLSGSSDYWFEINSKELSVDNNLDTNMRDDSFRMRIQEGIRDVELTATTYGEAQSYRDARRALQNIGADIVWDFSSQVSATTAEIVLNTAKLTDVGIGPYDAEESQMTIDETFTPEGGGRSGLDVRHSA